MKFQVFLEKKGISYYFARLSKSAAETACRFDDYRAQIEPVDF